MKSKSIDIKKITINRIKPKKQQTLRELQLSLLNSLAKNPVINLTKKRKKFPLDFDDYISKMDDSLNKYHLYLSKIPSAYEKLDDSYSRKKINVK